MIKIVNWIIKDLFYAKFDFEIKVISIFQYSVFQNDDLVNLIDLNKHLREASLLFNYFLFTLLTNGSKKSLLRLINEL